MSMIIDLVTSINLKIEHVLIYVFFTLFESKREIHFFYLNARETKTFISLKKLKRTNFLTKF